MVVFLSRIFTENQNNGRMKHTHEQENGFVSRFRAIFGSSTDTEFYGCSG